MVFNSVACDIFPVSSESSSCDGGCDNKQHDRTNLIKLHRLFEKVPLNESISVSFSEGTYHFYPDFAKELTLCISNHDEDTLKRVAFPVIGRKGFKLRGVNKKTHFIFHSDIIPFYFHQCSDINISGIDIDYARPIYSQGTILSISPREALIHIDHEKYPFTVKKGKLLFPRNGEEQPLYRWLEMDSIRGGPVYDTNDIAFGVGGGCIDPLYELVDEDTVKLTLINENEQFLDSSRVGNHLILRHHLRTHPGFYLSDCEDVSITDVNVFHASGMAFIAERTKNILLKDFNVKINPDNPRIFSATADATHFVYCYGKITIDHCLFENQLDDPVNIHGIYARIYETLSSTELLAELVHEQQKGVPIGFVGQEIRIVDNETMLPVHTASIRSIRTINKDFVEIEMDKPCDLIQKGFVLENIFYTPEVHIKDCEFRNNRARGLLLTSGGRVLVEHCKFHVPGSAILVEGDSNYWFESGATSEIIIRENEFNDCAYVQAWGKAPIQVTPSTRVASGTHRYHKRLVVENNIFRCFDSRLLFAKHIEQVVFRNNRIIKTNTFPAIKGEAFEQGEVLELIEEGNKQVNS